MFLLPVSYIKSFFVCTEYLGCFNHYNTFLDVFAQQRIELLQVDDITIQLWVFFVCIRSPTALVCPIDEILASLIIVLIFTVQS